MPSQAKQDIRAHEIPEQPWAKVGLDLFQSKGKDYLIIVDYLTHFFKICPLSQTLTSDVIVATKEQFARHGLPVVVESDGGPQFMAHEFQVFASTWGFVHTFSSPYNSRSNGKAESAVKIAKRLLKMCLDPYLALLEWRNTPTSGMGSSPNQRLFSRRTRGGLVTSQERLKPEIQEDMWEHKIRKQQNRQRPAKVQLEPIQVGQPVLVQDWLSRKTQWKRGRWVDQLSDRSYIVDMDDQILRRNRVFLRPSSHQPDVDAEDRMSDQGPTQVLPAQNVGNPALEVTTLPREAMTVEQEVSTPVNGDQLREGSSVNQHPPAAVENFLLTVTPVVGKDRVQTRSGRVVRERTRFKDFVKHT